MIPLNPSVTERATLTLDQLCTRECIYASRVLACIDDVDQSDEEAVRVAIRSGLPPSLKSYADLFAGALTDERTAAVIEGMALPGARVRSKLFGYGTVLCSYRNAGSLGGWIYRVRFVAPYGLRAVSANQVIWVGGLQRDRQSFAMQEAAE